MPTVKIFDQSAITTESWSAQGAVLQWGKSSSSTPTGGVPLLLESVRIQYAQQSSMVYPIAQTSTSRMRINIKGAPSGTLQTTGIFCPSGMKDLDKFLTAVSKDCKTTADQIKLYLSPFGAQNCGTAQKQKFVLYDVELQSVGIDIQGSEVAMVRAPFTFIFTKLDWEM